MKLFSANRHKTAVGALPVRTFRLQQRRPLIIVFVVLLAVAGSFYVWRLTRAVTVTIDPSLPQPRNVTVYGDDEVATVTWDAPTNTNGIVGYYVQWGKAGEPLTKAKQTIYTMTQIQPLENGVTYTVSVQSVAGTITSSVVRDGKTYHGEYAVADGRVSPPVHASGTATAARVDAMKQRLTGFFDDFDLPAGNFDETKWNSAYTGCADPGYNGAFINNQLHAHNQVRARVQQSQGLPYCDRAASASRPRAVFDVSGATEANPALIEIDADGASRNRDIWYIDLIPVTARTNGVPVDLEGHDDFFQEDRNEPGSMLRLTQTIEEVFFNTWDASRNPSIIRPLELNCPHWSGEKADLTACNMSKKVTTYSPIPLPNDSAATMLTVPNVRKHWVIEYSPTKISLIINGIRVMTVPTPAHLAGITKFQVTSELFSYTTGKDFEWRKPAIEPTVSLFHWDNFGFSGPAPTTVTHNYLDGGSDGTVPQIATGTPTHPFRLGNRTAKVPIPDAIGSPVQARVMFTINPLTHANNGAYTWFSAHHIVVNGKNYSFPNPANNMPSPAQNPIASNYTPHSTGIIINANDLRIGMNDITFNLGTDVTNVHIELEYAQGSQPAYTQPQDIFANFNAFIAPPLDFNDNYLFIEQDMGLPGVPPDDHQHPGPDPEQPGSQLGDVNGDGHANAADLAIVLANYGRTGLGRSSGDLSGDGAISVRDLSEVIAAYH